MILQRFPAELEYKRWPDLSKETVHQIMEWANKQPHLPKVSEEDVILFLSSCYYSSERAKQTVDLYYTIRTHVPEFFANRDTKDKFISEQFKVASAIPLDGLTDKEHKVFYSRLIDFDLSKYSLEGCIKTGGMCLDYMVAEEGAHMGLEIVFDLSGFTLGHLAKLNIFSMKKMLMYLQDGSPVRLCGIHYIFPVPFMDALMGMVRPFLNKTTSDALHIHKSLDEFYKYIPKRVLPKEAGGDLPSINKLHEAYVEKIMSNREWFLEQDKRTVDESLRPGKAKNISEIFGVEGTFKKLDID